MSCNGDYPDSRLTWPVKVPVQVPEGGPRGRGQGRVPCSSITTSVRGWTPIGPVLDASVISTKVGVVSMALYRRLHRYVCL